MPRCLNCGESLVRTHRKLWEKLIYDLVFKCRACGLRVGEKYHFFLNFGPDARCPRCGTTQLDKRNTRDKIDKLIKTPTSMVHALLGGYLYHCVFCRIQFYDVRKRARRTTPKATAVSTGEQPAVAQTVVRPPA